MKEDYNMKYRLDLNISELERLQEILADLKESEKYNSYYLELDSFKSLSKMIERPKEIKYSGAKGNAAAKATEARTKQAKEKIDNAINILRFENKKITHYSISKMSAVSYNTVKKYLSDDDIISFNSMK